LLGIAAVLCASSAQLFAQNELPDLNTGKTKEYYIGNVAVDGNTYFSDNQIVQLSGLFKGNRITVPGQDISNVINRLWAQRYFRDVAVTTDSISSNNDSIYLRIIIKERPRVSRWSFSGIKGGERKDLQERLNLRRGGEFSDYVSKTSCDIISRYFKEKGFGNVVVTPEVTKDTIVKNAIRVNFNIEKGKKVKIKDINFTGNDHLGTYRLYRSMKKTKAKKWYNFFNSKKFNAKEYENDKKNLITAYNEAGFRDARIVRDSVYTLPDGRVSIDIDIDEGRRYYFRNITWTGNSVYTSDMLSSLLRIDKGDVYDMVTMEKRLLGGGKQSDYDVAKLYRDNGYLFFNVKPVELNVAGDSVDVEMRIVEGKQATLNNIIINGNDLTNERVVRRQIFTRPGYLYSQSDFERSIREIASMGQFDPESIYSSDGYSILPDEANHTVDLVYNVTEKPSSQLELSGGWGGKTFIGTVGISFNNFSTRRIRDKSAWRPVPLGDAQTLALRLQTSGTYYTALSLSFMEPWLFGKKPTSLNISAYYTRQTNSYLAWNIMSHDREMEIFGLSAGIGNRLNWPDNYFVLYNSLSWQTYRLRNWYSNYFIFDDGVAHNISYTLALTRNSTDQQIFPRQGSDISLSLQFTPPFSLFRRTDKGTLDANGNPVKVGSYKDINYNNWTAKQRYKWIEYHKWTMKADFYTKIAGDLILKTRAQFGYLGYYNRKWGYSPFEGFLVGGDGMTGYNNYGNDVISLRGYENYALTPIETSSYNSNGYNYAGNVYDKFSVELRYPIILQPQSTIYGLIFAEGGNAWSDIKNFNPFEIKRSAGVGVRIFLPVVGLIGIDWGYGFDKDVSGNKGGSQFHFIIGQEF
jgi:outer membrane protein insertion porin family